MVILHWTQSIGNVVPVHTVNACRDVAVQLCLFLFLSLDGGEWSYYIEHKV